MTSPAEKILKEYLSSVSTNFPTQKTYEAIVLEHGRKFAPPVTPRPKGIRKGRNRLCFMNAYRLANREDFRYVEGFAISDIGILIPVQHAWVVDNKDNVIETTWKESGLAYSGIVFDLEFVNRVICETKLYGIMDYRSETFRERFAKENENE